MSGLEALGGVASAIQLATTGLQIAIGISNLYSKLHDAHQSVRKRKVQIQQLIDLLHLIQDNPSLQTTLISSILAICIKDSSELRDILARLIDGPQDGAIKRYWKAIDSITKENQILEIFKRLEEEKSVLTLCIASIDSKLLYTIERKIMDVSYRIDTIAGELSTIRGTSEGVASILAEIRLMSAASVILRKELLAILDLFAAKQTELLDGTPRTHDGVTARNLTSLPEGLPVLRKAVDSVLTREENEGTESNTAISHQRLPADEKAVACLSSLGATEQQNLVSGIITQHKYACRWFLDGVRFRAWIESTTNDLLYVTTTAGCGKTTLAANVIQYFKDRENELEDQDKAHPEDEAHKRFVLLYFFFQKASLDLEGSANAALRTLISQLVHQIPSLYGLLLRQYEFLSTKGNFIWSWETLQGLFVQMLSKISPKIGVYIVLDGFDECSHDSREGLLVLIRSLIEVSPMESCNIQGSFIRILVTGRPDQQIFDSISPSYCLEITKADSYTDMQALIRSSVQRLAICRHLAPEIEESVIRFLESNAEGMFLWIELIIKELERRDERLTDVTLTSRLNKVPLSLMSIYETILRNGPKSRQEDVWRIFRWLLFSKRSLSLIELETALCLETNSTQWYDFGGDVKFLCSSLVRIEDDGNVRFVHQTARDFVQHFAKDAALTDLGGIKMDNLAVNAHIAELCIEFIGHSQQLQNLLDTVLSGSLSEYKEAVDIYLRKTPFLAYATEYWASHLQGLETPGSGLSSALVKLLDGQENRDALIRLTYYFSHSGSPYSPRETSKLHIAGYFNIPWLVVMYLQQGLDPDCVADMGDTPLIWASEMGSLECVKQLLDAGAKPNKVEIDGWSPLHWAATNNHVRLCELLLENGADPGLVDGIGRIPEDWAISRGNYEIVRAIQNHASKIKTQKPWQRVLSFRQRNAKAKNGPAWITDRSEIQVVNHHRRASINSEVEIIIEGKKLADRLGM